jgi:WD40 repeat protein
VRKTISPLPVWCKWKAGEGGCFGVEQSLGFRPNYSEVYRYHRYHFQNAVALTQDGQRAVSASWDKTVRLSDLETGEVLATFTCDSTALRCAYSDTLKLIVAGDAGGHLHFLRLEEPKAKG